MIDRGDIRQAINCHKYLPPGAGYGQFEHMADSLIAKFKEAGGTVRDYVWAESPRLFPLWLSASSSACHGLLIITVITPLLYKAQRDKNARELKLANAAITDMQMRQRDAAAWWKYTKELADAKAENDASRDDAAAGRRRCTSKQSVSQCELPPPPARIMQPRLADTPLNGISLTSERLITMQKQLEGTQKYINECG